MIRNALLRTVAGCCLIAWTLAAVATAQEPRESVEAMQADAQLADVTFVDARRGWAVGDRGVIWHTDDGGRHWSLQASGVDCRLASVFFLDDQLGWAAGGYTQPYTHTTVGVVLLTRDGGATWSVRRDRILPTVEKIGFFDRQHGWAVGRSSALFPGGAFTTDDGGRSWQAVPGTSTQSWLAADFVDTNTGAVAGRDGLFATVRRRGIDLQPTDFGLRALRRMKLAAPTTGWLVGDGGLVLHTTDLGKSWQTTDGALPPGGSTQFDYQALAVLGEHAWVAGTPGTRVFHTPDGGRSWEAFDTGYAIPIRGLAFVDTQQGWAVGDLGQILSTNDGGRTWRKQRAGGERAALVGFFSRPGELPLELLAKLSADEGYLGVMELLNRDSVDIRSPDAAGNLAHEATVAAGASAAAVAWRFPLRSTKLKLSADQLIEDWNRVNDGEALEKFEAYVVGRIRMWRPSVLVTVGADARDPVALAVNQVVLRAAEYAADPTRFPQQLAEAGLKPWSVQKVYAALDEGVGTSTINAAQVTTRLGRSIGELAAPARGLVSAPLAVPASGLGFRLLVDRIPQGVGERDFFSGIPLSPGGEARRAYVETSQNNLAAAQREARRYRNLQAILDRADKQQSEGHLLANIGDQTADLAPDRAAEVLFQLAERYWIKGQSEPAAECYDVVAERHKTHPLAGAALAWLVEYYGSYEAAHRARDDNTHRVQQVSAQAVASPDGKAAGLPAGGVGGALQPTGQHVLQLGMLADGEVTEDTDKALGRAMRATGYMKQLEQVEPAVAFEPRVRFALSVAERRQGLSGPALRFYQALRQTRPADAWRTCAESELWLFDRKGNPPKALWECPRSASKPRLDGKLDEPLWHAGNVVELRSPQRDDADWPCAVMLAYDEEFLYVGVSASRAEGFRYQNSSDPRPRDADLAFQDRVELLVDIDRDYATYYRLVIDHRGWTAESCWHDPTWNPAWYVASGGDDEVWTAEAAIPLAELTGDAPDAKTTWAVGVQRVVPGVGFQSWTTPADPAILPEGFGYLMFEQ